MEIIARWYSKKNAGFRGRRWERCVYTERKTTCVHHEETDTVKTVLIHDVSAQLLSPLGCFCLTCCCRKHTDEDVKTKQSGERSKDAPRERSLFETAFQNLWAWNHRMFLGHIWTIFSPVSGNKTRYFFMNIWVSWQARDHCFRQHLSVKPMVFFFGRTFGHFSAICCNKTKKIFVDSVTVSPETADTTVRPCKRETTEYF